MRDRTSLLLIAIAVCGCGDDASRPSSDAGGVLDAGGADAARLVDAGTAPLDAGSADDSGGPGSDAAAADTWASFAEGFFVTYCVECHSGGTRDYRTTGDVTRDADTIRCGVSPDALSGCGSFPPPRQFPVGTGPRPSDEERRRLVAWIDAGLP